MSAVDLTYYGDPDDSASKVSFFMTLFAQVRARRTNFETLWEESAQVAWPEYSGSFFFGRDIAPGAKRQQYQLTSKVSIASWRFGAIADWMLTPSHMMWSKIQFKNRDLMKDRDAALWCSMVSKILWSERYRDTANFIGQNHQNMQGLGVFGNMAMWTDQLATYLDPKERGLSYLGLPVGEVYIMEDHQKRIVGCIRAFRLTAQQFKQQFPKAKPCSIIEAALQISSQQLFDVLHFVRPNTDYHPEYMLHPRRRWKFESTYLLWQAYEIIEEGGYRTLPLSYGRYLQAPDETYGRGPLQIVLASSKTYNAEKRVFLKQGHLAGDPAYLVFDTGLTDLKAHPGAFNAGGMTNDGKPLVSVLPTGQIQITKELMDEELSDINAAFLVDLFQLILGDKQNEMGPRQVIEYLNERAVLLAPTIGAQTTGYLGPLHNRELDVLSWLRKLPPLPPILREATRADVEMEYTTTISRAMQSQESAGYMRTWEFAAEASKAAGDPSLMDYFEFDKAIPAMGEQNNAPPEWFSSKKSVAAKRQQREQAAERERQVKELPGKAAIIKAQAVQTKAQTGGNIGGTLSGVPPQQMPQIPDGQGAADNNPGFGGP